MVKVHSPSIISHTFVNYNQINNSDHSDGLNDSDNSDDSDDEILKIANNALEKGDALLLLMSEIKKKQEGVQREIGECHSKIKENHRKIHIVQKEQETAFGQLKKSEAAINQSNEKIRLLNSNGNALSSHFSRINSDQKQLNATIDKLDNQTEEVKKKSYSIKLNQLKMRKRIKKLNDQQKLNKNIESIASNLQNKQEQLNNVFNRRFRGIKKNIVIFYRFFSKMIDEGMSKVVSIIKWLALKIIDFSMELGSQLKRWIWSNLIGNVSITTWIVLGILTSCFIYYSLTAYPVTSFILLGMVFLLIKDVVLPIFNCLKTLQFAFFDHQKIAK